MEQNVCFQSGVLQEVWACIGEVVCDLSTLKAWPRGGCFRKPKQAHRKCSGHLNHSPVKVGSVAQEKPHCATRSRSWQHSYLRGPRIRINEHIELACCGSFAPHESCQLRVFAADSRHIHQKLAELTKRPPDIVKYRAKPDGRSPKEAPFPTGHVLQLVASSSPSTSRAPGNRVRW